MKRQWTILLTAGACAAMLSGCGGNSTRAAQSAPNDAETFDSGILGADADAFAADTETADAFSATADSQQDTPQFITETDALAIAFRHAGISGDDIQLQRSRLGRDHGVDQYELTFTSGGMEYDYEIDAATGVILEAEQEEIHDDIRTDSAPVFNDGSLTAEDAKAIALEHAGLTETDVSRLKAEFDTDDGRSVYEVEFHVGRTEYKYELDARTGEILEYEIDDD